MYSCCWFHPVVSGPSMWYSETCAATWFIGLRYIQSTSTTNDHFVLLRFGLSRFRIRTILPHTWYEITICFRQSAQLFLLLPTILCDSHSLQWTVNHMSRSLLHMKCTFIDSQRIPFFTCTHPFLASTKRSRVHSQYVVLSIGYLYRYHAHHGHR